jgi:hypothetical protein
MAVASGMGPVIVSYPAGADLSTHKYKFVKRSGANVILCAAATDIPLGVLQNDPTSGQAASVMIFGETKINADAALAVDALIGTSADGQADAKTVGTDTTEYVVGRVSIATANAGELGSALINCLTPHRAS